jgi:tripartite-type tricarboxylate transporter receptor subunit TctC
MRLWNRLAISILLAACVPGQAPAQSFPQTFPSRPIRLIVPFAAGGSADGTARLVAPGMSELLGQPVIVENRPGGNGNIAAEAVAKAPPDGYTLLVAASNFAPVAVLSRNLPFDPIKDFTPVTQLIATEFALVAHSRLQVGTLKELVTLAKSKPGALNYGSSGVANPLHLAMELLKTSAGVDIVPVPYKGDGPLFQALIAGEVDVAVVGLSQILPHIKSGRVKALGVTSAKRSSAMPEIPTISEQGVASIDTPGWHALFAPGRTPPEVVGALAQAASKSVNTRENKERLALRGQEAVGSTPAEFDAKFKAEIVKFAEIVKNSRIPLQD